MADFAATWLGWDVARGTEVPLLDVPGLHDVTMTPRKYGFHGTLKPPFRLSGSHSRQDLELAISDIAASLGPARCEGLNLIAMGRFLALTPRGDIAALQRVAAACVRELDRFRVAPSLAELEQRRNAGLTSRQEAMLLQWGYPYVMDEFRFHLTLSGRLPRQDMQQWIDILHSVLPDLPAPFVVDQIALCGEREDGRFELIHRYTLAG